MDSHKYSTQVERLEVVETGRRRRWSDDEKLRIVIESLQTPRAISSTARRHGISRSLLMRWQRSLRRSPGNILPVSKKFNLRHYLAYVGQYPVFEAVQRNGPSVWG